MHQRGFTLLEVLVAFTLLAVVGGALLELFQSGSRGIAAHADHQRAAILAQGQLAELGIQRDLLPGEAQGEFDERFHWRLKLTPYEEEGLSLAPQRGARLLLAELSVFWGPRQDPRAYHLRSLLLSQAQQP